MNNTYLRSKPTLFLLSIFVTVFWTFFSIATNEEVITIGNLVPIIALNIYVIYLLYILATEYYNNNLNSHLALFSVAMMLYFGFFGILYYEDRFFTNPANDSYKIYAILLIFLYTVIYHITTLSLRHLDSSRENSRGITMWSNAKVLLVVIALILIGSYGRFLIIDNGIYFQMTYIESIRSNLVISNLGIIRFLERLPDFAAWIAWIHYLNRAKNGIRSNRIIWGILATALILISVIYWMPTGKKFQIIQSLIIPPIIWYATFRYLPQTRYLLALIIFIFLLFPASHVYRVAQAEFVQSQGGRFNTNILDIIKYSFQRTGDVQEIGARGRTFGRFNQLEVVSGSIRTIEERNIELRLGTNYFDALINLVPRFIWPEKPYVFYGNEFGHQIGQLSYSDNATSIAPTLIGEAYLNFNVFGAFIAAVIASIFHVLNLLEKRMRSPESGRLLYAAAIPTILYVDASFALYFSSLFQVLVFIYLICLYLQRSRIRPL